MSKYDVDIAAGEYVLGILSPEQRHRFEERLENEPVRFALFPNRGLSLESVASFGVSWLFDVSRPEQLDECQSGKPPDSGSRHG